MPMPPPHISAIICTHNREAYLPAAINSLLRQNFDNYEIIVVDNASTDNTRTLVEPYLSDSRVRYVYEERLGLSIARNTGANVANGSLLAYLDDDAEASQGWLSAIAHIYEQDESVAIAGGKITLVWPPHFQPPRWLSHNLASNLGAYDLGDEITIITEPGLTPRGLNYAIRADFLTAIGGFDLRLGRIGSNLLSHEELYMTEKALAAGWKVMYVPAAIVAHHVASDRLTPWWFLSRSWWQGISDCYRERQTGRSGWRQLPAGTERLLRGLYKSLKYLPDPALRFENLLYAYGQVGYLSSAIKGLLPLIAG